MADAIQRTVKDRGMSTVELLIRQMLSVQEQQLAVSREALEVSRRKLEVLQGIRGPLPNRGDDDIVSRAIGLIAKHRCNVSAIARELGIKRSTLDRQSPKWKRFFHYLDSQAAIQHLVDRNGYISNGRADGVTEVDWEAIDDRLDSEE